MKKNLLFVCLHSINFHVKRNKLFKKKFFFYFCCLCKMQKKKNDKKLSWKFMKARFLQKFYKKLRIWWKTWFEINDDKKVDHRTKFIFFCKKCVSKKWMNVCTPNRIICRSAFHNNFFVTIFLLLLCRIHTHTHLSRVSIYR